jgi:hypothetical protein
MRRLAVTATIVDTLERTPEVTIISLNTPPAPARTASDAAAHVDRKAARRQSLSRQAERSDRRANRFGKIAERLSTLRLAVFFGGAGVSLGGGLLSPRVFVLALILSVVAFAAAVGIHRRFKVAAQRWAFWAANQRAQIARMDLDWDHIPDLEIPDSARAGTVHHSPAGTPAEQHPFERDLDLTGPRSVHQLLNTATSAEGSLRLKDWLLDLDPQLAIIQRRQRHVHALIGRTAFRAKLQWEAAPLSGRGALDAAILQWVAEPAPVLPIWSIPVLGILALANIGLGLATIIQPVTIPVLATPRAIIFVLYVVIYAAHARFIRDLFDEATGLGAAFQPLERIFRLLERAPAKRGDDTLNVLLAPFHGAARPSMQLRSLNRIVAAASLRGSPFLWLALNALVPWDLIVYIGLQHARRTISAALPRWLDTWHELEALSSLANYAFLNPTAIFPAFTADGPLLEGDQLGHPLIPDAAKVRNDFRLGDVGELILVTGSNMSGKSSFLRTVGVAAAIGYAGGSADAARFTMRVCRVYACMRVTDSVTDGISYFYAEVRRLRALLSALERADERPVLYLIDEIFRGTNNRERLIGSRAYLRALVGQFGAGLVSTHDLELVELARALPTLHNMHFRETIADGVMVFDYKLRPGPSPTTNALTVMRLAGLPVEESQPQGV